MDRTTLAGLVLYSTKWLDTVRFMAQCSNTSPGRGPEAVHQYTYKDEISSTKILDNPLNILSIFKRPWMGFSVPPFLDHFGFCFPRWFWFLVLRSLFLERIFRSLTIRFFCSLLSCNLSFVFLVLPPPPFPGPLLLTKTVGSAGATIRQTKRSPRAQSKGEGRKNYPRGVQNVSKITKRGVQNLSKITKGGCKTHQNWPKRVANLIN